MALALASGGRRRTARQDDAGEGPEGREDDEARRRGAAAIGLKALRLGDLLWGIESPAENQSSIMRGGSFESFTPSATPVPTPAPMAIAVP